MLEKLCSLWLTLTLASNRVILHKNVTFSILVHSTKRRYSSFLKKVFIFRKICFKVKVLKTLKISSDNHIKACRSLKRSELLWKSAVPVFRRTYAPSVGFKKKPLRQRFSCVKEKINSNFAVKLAERSNRSFSVYLMNHLFQAFAFFNLWQ